MNGFWKLGIDEENEDLVLAQYKSLSRHVPLLYGTLIAGTVVLCSSFIDKAPIYLAVGAPLLLSLVAMMRGFAWWRRGSRQISLVISACGVLVAEMVIQGSPSTAGLAINAVIVAATIIVNVISNNRDFAQLIQSRQDLAHRNDEANRLVEKNHRLAINDMLTGLPNRRWFFGELPRILANHYGSGQPGHTMLAVIDLDGFKPVNDLHGHTAGDMILTEVAGRLRGFANDRIKMARLGGDEFAMICHGIARKADAAAIGRAIAAELSRPYIFEDFTARVDATLGFSTISTPQSSGSQLYEEADYALNYAKRSARGTVAFFTAQHQAAIRDASEIEQTLRQADLSAEMRIEYQPIVNPASGRTQMFEALGRWSSPVLGEVAPRIFIEAAERSAQIGEVTKVMLSCMLREMPGWPEHIRISFNLSVHDISSFQTMRQIVAMVRAAEVDPRRIDFEITETAIMHDFDRAIASLNALKELGCGISLDDFGTGHSSLSYVHQLPLDKIKIDRTFVKDIESDPTRLALTRSIIGLCYNLDLECVVEGIETAEQSAIVARLGKTSMQGFLFGAAVSQEKALALLAAEEEAGLVALDAPLGHSQAPDLQAVLGAAQI